MKILSVFKKSTIAPPIEQSYFKINWFARFVMRDTIWTQRTTSFAPKLLKQKIVEFYKKKKMSVTSVTMNTFLIHRRIVNCSPRLSVVSSIATLLKENVIFVRIIASLLVWKEFVIM